VVKIPDPTVKILDFRFLNDSQIICSSLRVIDGASYPCIDVYDIPKSQLPVDETNNLNLLYTRDLSIMRLAASFQLPALVGPQPKCLWTRPGKSYSQVSEFAIRLPRPAGLNALVDQAMTFRLEGRVRGKSEKLQGVILLSRLVGYVDQVVKTRSDGPSATAGAEAAGVDTAPVSGISTTESTDTFKATPVVDDYNQVCFKWAEWSSAVSLQQSTSSTVLDPNYTQVASIARSRTNKSRAVMVIRDYNQRMLYAPVGHLTRNLGHPTENCDADQPKEPEKLVKPFIAVAEAQCIQSVLFGGDVEYGLRHRVRTVGLGEYGPNTATSRMFWGSNCMEIVPATATVSPIPHKSDE
jgi:hypothetical protein